MPVLMAYSHRTQSRIRAKVERMFAEQKERMSC